MDSPDEVHHDENDTTQENPSGDGQAAEHATDDSHDEGQGFEPIIERTQSSNEGHDFESSTVEASQQRIDLLGGADQTTESEPPSEKQMSDAIAPASDIRDFAPPSSKESVMLQNDTSVNENQNTQEASDDTQLSSIPGEAPLSGTDKGVSKTTQSLTGPDGQPDSSSLLNASGRLLHSSRFHDEPDLEAGDKTITSHVEHRVDFQPEANLEVEDEPFDLEEDDEVDNSHNTAQNYIEDFQTSSLDEIEVKSDMPIEGGPVNGSQISASTTQAPVTPSKTKTAKRKLQEEDEELELLDLGTPDNKRRRPS